ncbi:hypothetical protein [Hwangdonia lutea]|uniref:DUF5017 domain-containing protein n=1 Tax=Hwangdonia lutea TaxID=3075823 RepID=A0AA97EQH5_9FLAO|nr:hypothetical protein [Hwangdonia sp. SCSIO 19198]WOD44734.1 hypothetical protein RNZ46_05595 [Hwangdonia sp. SCSIO 19198]
MKKLIYLIAVLGITFTGCNPNEDIYNKIDAEANPIVGDAVITLSDEDYDELELNFGNFNSVDDAKAMLPSFLEDKYPVWGKGSSALVTFKWYNPIETYEAAVYELSDAEHNAITGNTYGNFDENGHIYDYLDATYPNPEEGDFVSLRYRFYSGGEMTLTDGFAFEDGSWVKFTGFTEDQYNDMGEGFPNFSSEDEANQKIPIALLDIFKFNPKSAGDIVLSMYELYVGGGVTESYTAAYIFDGVAFSAYSNVAEETVQFGHDGTTWVPDNTIKYTFTTDDVALISNALIGTYPGPADNVGFFGSFDRRESSSNYWSDAMLLEAFNLLLDNKHPSAEEGQKYVLTFIIYNGATTNETKSVIKTGGVWVYQ